MNTLALDIALTTGWAICIDGEIRCGTWQLRPGKSTNHQCPGLNLWEWLSNMHYAQVIGRVVQEAPIVFPGRPSGARTSFGLAMACQMWCEHKGIEWSSVPPAKIKAHATGKGNANKSAMVAAAQSKWPNLGVTDDNAADALWLLDYVDAGP